MKKTPDVRKPEELRFKPLPEAAALVRSRDISSVELTQSLLKRIVSLDGRRKSYAEVTAGQALAAAERADRGLAEKKCRGPLHGVPAAVKDLCFTKGVRTMGERRRWPVIFPMRMRLS